MKFSIVVPAHNAEKTIERCLTSLVKQSISQDDYEIVVIDDASQDDTLDKIKSLQMTYANHNWKIIQHEQNQNKAISRNDGMIDASGDWICWLDADDFYLPFYLEIMNQAIEKYPDSKLFYFGGIITWSRWDMMIKMPNKVNKGDVFRSGGIMSGGFIFKKECLDEKCYLPFERSPYGFGDEMLRRYPEIVPLYKPGQLDLGNPWGDDWAEFYLLTRHFQPQFLNVSPYVVYQRGEHQL
jgi:glycosyltransferase involved in cell wall biosynthesis